MTTTIDQFFYLIPKLTNHGALSPACGRGLPLIYQLRKKAGRFHVLQFLLLSIVRKQKNTNRKTCYYANDDYAKEGPVSMTEAAAVTG